MIRKALVMLFAVLAVGGIAAPAMAGQVAKPADSIQPNTPYHICMREATSECLSSEGFNVQVQVTSGDRTDYCYVYQGETTGNVPIYVIRVCNEPTHCLKGDSDDVVRTVTCDITDRQQFWELSNNNYENAGLTINSGSPQFMGTFGTADGGGVFCNTPVTNFYWTWFYYAQ